MSHPHLPPRFYHTARDGNMVKSVEGLYSRPQTLPNTGEAPFIFSDVSDIEGRKVV